MTSAPAAAHSRKVASPRRLPLLVGGLAVAALVAVNLAGGPLVTLRPLDPATGRVVLNDAQGANGKGQNQKFAVDSFDALAYARQQWATDVAPILRENTVPLATLLGALAEDSNGAADRYGLPHNTRAKNLAVSGQARVAQADVKSPMGLLTLEFPDEPALAHTKVQLLTGPLVISTVLRDIVPDMSLNNFTNQTQYADVAAALNKVALENAYGQVPAASLVGKTVDFTGVLNLQSPSSLRIVPVSVMIKESP
ncbi:DUF2291 family protein [Pseudomonas japonica]|uniref:DUF2291 family protein n=1 Tax=Pseudomonas japonica TaxID=256466 RepID=UPI0015E2C5EE|nr:DUF2291 family protein [Pseudomonas japonica]MBA1291137.1 DUF2291 domain-containing protein [Pseudomonas japonica]